MSDVPRRRLAADLEPARAARGPVCRRWWQQVSAATGPGPASDGDSAGVDSVEVGRGLSGREQAVLWQQKRLETLGFDRAQVEAILGAERDWHEASRLLAAGCDRD